MNITDTEVSDFVAGRLEHSAAFEISLEASLKPELAERIVFAREARTRARELLARGRQMTELPDRSVFGA